jgi:hypothetical protein
MLSFVYLSVINLGGVILSISILSIIMLRVMSLFSVVLYIIKQGIHTEGEGSVHLTSSLR